MTKIKKLTAILFSIPFVFTVTQVSAADNGFETVNTNESKIAAMTTNNKVYLRYDGLTDYIKHILVELQVFYEIKDADDNLIMTVRAEDIINGSTVLEASLLEMLTWSVDVKNVPDDLKNSVDDLFKIVYTKENNKNVLKIQCPQDKDISRKITVTSCENDVITSGYDNIAFDTIEYDSENNVIYVPYCREACVHSELTDMTFTFDTYKTISSVIKFINKVGTGDIDGDENVTLSDISLMSDCLMKRCNLDEKQFAAADMNHDNKINVFDMILLKREFMNT